MKSAVWLSFVIPEEKKALGFKDVGCE